MKLYFFLIAAFGTATLGQDDIQDAINSVFGNSSDFLANYEEVTQPPLKSYGALSKCGEDDQRGRYVCVPYYNCDGRTNTTVEAPIKEVDFSDLIDIRAGDPDRKCDHYLDVCCQMSSDATLSTSRPIEPTPSPTPTVPVTEPVVVKSPAFCGIRNAQGIDFKITGNTNNEAEFGEFPWMTAVMKKSFNPATDEKLVLCGGSLITPLVVLTGAHCVADFKANELKIRGGEWDMQTEKERIPYQERNISRIIIHENYVPKKLYDDVALLILDRPFAKTESIGTVCLPNQDEKFNSKECFATGWGKQVFGKEVAYSAILKKIQLPVVQNNNCQRALRTTRLGENFVLHKSFICAGGEAGKDTCTGDGGSPLVCPDPTNPGRYKQVGIVAWGIGCGELLIPGVYVDVSQFRNWIDRNLQQLQINSGPYTL